MSEGGWLAVSERGMVSKRKVERLNYRCGQAVQAVWQCGQASASSQRRGTPLMQLHLLPLLSTLERSHPCPLLLHMSQADFLPTRVGVSRKRHGQWPLTNLLTCPMPVHTLQKSPSTYPVNHPIHILERSLMQSLLSSLVQCTFQEKRMQPYMINPHLSHL